MEFKPLELLYENPLSTAEHLRDFVLEGDAAITFPRGRLRMENAYERDKGRGLHANFVLWCPRDFPDGISVSWDFRPLSDAGLAMFWVAAKGCHGQDLFDRSLKRRSGDYKQYFKSDINALHGSYFRRNPTEIGFRTCNLRKSYGFHLVCRAGDPLPDSIYATEPYRLEVIKAGSYLRFSVNHLMVYEWTDDGESYGPVLEDGKIGFRQMAGLIAEYAGLRVHKVEPID